MEGHVLSEFEKGNTSIMANGNQTALNLHFEKAFGIISFSFGSVITVVNSFSLLCLIRYKQHISSGSFWQQLLFLCLTDIFSGLGISVIYLGSLLSFLHSSVYYTFCVSGLIIFPLSTTLSIGNCCMISVQRYIGMRKITRQRRTWGERRTTCVILLNILLSIVTFVASVCMVAIRFGFDYEEFCNKVNQSGQNEYKSQFVTGTILIGMIFLLCINVFTFLSISELAKAKREQSSLSSMSEATLNLHSRQVQEFRYATKTFIYIVIALNITVLPTLIFIPLIIKYDINVTAETTEIFSRFCTLNSLLNPFLYFSRMRNVRKALWDDVKKLF